MFNIHQKIDTRQGEIDERRAGEYMSGLMEEFAASPEAQPLIEKYGNVGWAHSMMEYSINYLGLTPAKMTLRDFNEVVFELIPRKVSVEPDSAPQIIDELRAFWSFIQRQYELTNAAKILEALGSGAAEKLRGELANPQNYGMAKSFVMTGQQAGFDMTTQEGMDAFTLAYNASLAGRRLEGLQRSLAEQQLPLDADFNDFDEGLPILPSPPTSGQREQKRKQRKAQRQARKRNRRK